MKLLLLLPLLLVGCASETYHLGTAKSAARGNIQGNGTNVTVIAKPDYYYFHADKIDNSTATRAGMSALMTAAKLAAKMYSPVPLR